MFFLLCMMLIKSEWKFKKKKKKNFFYFPSGSWSQCTVPYSAIKIKFNNIFAAFIFMIVLFGLCLKLSFELEEYLKSNFCSFPNPSWRQPTRFWKLIFNIFFGVLSQTVLPESTLKLFRSFSVSQFSLHFLKTRLWVRKNNFNTIFAPSLMAPEVTRQSLVNWCLAYFEVCFAKLGTQNQI